ncbi:rod shape-determining protein MreC [Occallatibacter savannae]|uniref:rod shape-determining protein MreC n=1 Tax=Occallatibacter savannae TaxID=1002691 RepID=UPI000D6913D0|nr:rod shape-determining protein MreC [Occallatibacter savannae]
MESFVVRYRNLLVLLALLVAQILGLAMQVRRANTGQGDGQEVRLIRLWANGIVSPPEKALHNTGSGISWIWNNYFYLRHVREQNADLQKTIDRLRLEQAALLEDAKQGQRLQALLNFQQKYIYKTVTAEVIGTSGTEQSRVFTINKGKKDGIDRDMAVITPDGIVGKVRDVFGHTAQVLAINDQSSGAGVIMESTRIRGVLRGNAQGRPEIVDVISDQRIRPGDSVLTAGGDQIFPRGLPVGVVDKVVNDPERDGFVDVVLKPAAHLDQLDEVLVITATEPQFSQEQQQDIATSETLKGAEAEKQKTSEGMAEKLPGLIDPKLPPDQQPLNDTSNPGFPSRPTAPLHPDRFTPANTAPAAPPAQDLQSSPKTTGKPPDHSRPAPAPQGDKQ